MFPGLKEIVDLLDEADEARQLAAKVKHDPASVRDLIKYADALETEAARINDEAAQKPREYVDASYRQWSLESLN
jgi:hypothetical protein